MFVIVKRVLVPLVLLTLLLSGGAMLLGTRIIGQEIAYTADTPRQSIIERIDIGRGLTVASYQSERRINGIAWSHDGNTLYFGGVNPDGRYRDLGALHVRSGRVTWLTADDADNTSPDVSPDGTQLVFQRFVSGQTDWDIYTLDLQTGTVSALYTGVSADTAPDWSPDGRFIAFETASVGRNSANIMLYDLQNDTTNRITTRLEGLPDWSPDGEQVLYASLTQGIFNIFSVQVVDGNATPDSAQRLTNLSAGSNSPAVAPDGGQIALVAWVNAPSSTALSPNYAQIFVMDADGANLRRVTTAPINHTNPVWRP